MKDQTMFLKVYIENGKHNVSYSSVLDAYVKNGFILLKRLDDTDITLKMLQYNLMQSDFYNALEVAISSFECVGEDAYVFVITDAKGVPLYCYKSPYVGWEEVKFEVKVNPVEISNELKNIEKWIGSAYQTDDEVDLALKAIRKIIGM